MPRFWHKMTFFFYFGLFWRLFYVTIATVKVHSIRNTVTVTCSPCPLLHYFYCNSTIVMYFCRYGVPDNTNFWNFLVWSLGKPNFILTGILGYGRCVHVFHKILGSCKENVPHFSGHSICLLVFLTPCLCFNYSKNDREFLPHSTSSSVQTEIHLIMICLFIYM